LWQTNSFVAFDESNALVCDPALAPAEIAAIGDRVADASPAQVTVLITHADFDHVCGIPAFAEAEVTAGADTSEWIRSGQAAKGLRAQGGEWGMSWGEELRVDCVVEGRRVVVRLL
jgi:glyoxylase-like metal-dependent hydrolase (beta-lactamase superfamily II)